MTLTKNNLISMVFIVSAFVGLCGGMYISSTPEKTTFILITSLYNETHPARIEEYKCCLQKNLEHPLIEKIHVLYDTAKDSEANSALLNYLQGCERVMISKIKGRPTYEYCFNLANQFYPQERIILSNADIYFNETLQDLNNYALSKKFLALTRWNVDKNNNLRFYRSPFSQDAWIFKTPIKIPKGSAIEMGTQHCDGKIAFCAKKAGLRVLNPSLSLQACHVHLSNIRNYKTNVNKQAPFYQMLPIRPTLLS